MYICLLSLKSLESEPYAKVVNEKRIIIKNISTTLVDKLKKLPRYLYLLYALLRVFIQIMQLLFMLFFQIKKPDFILVQVSEKIHSLL